jgi:hypothetical protein
MTLSSVRPTVTESGHLGPNSAFMRHAALAVLIRARGTPLSVADIWSSVKRDHIVQVGLTARTRRRILAHEREIRPGDGITMVHVMTRMRDHGSR